MAWQDRPYYRDQSGSTGNPFMWLLTGSVHLFTLFGIRVRAHASLIVLLVLVLLFGVSRGDNVEARVQGLSVLFLVILLHEFGHCFAARWTGGEANEILMTPLGGLAMAMARRRPLPTFITIAGGPAVNVIICLVCGFALFLTIGFWPLGPWSISRAFDPTPGWLQISSYLFWFYTVSYALLLFNMLPVFPLDGGQMLQSILWKPLGYYRSMLITMNVGLVGSVLMVMAGIAMLGMGGFGLLMVFIGANCFINCFQMRAMLRTEGPWAFQNEDSVDYGADLQASLRPERKRKPGLMSKLAASRRAKAAREEASEQRQIDAILAKVSQHGMHSLSWMEKRTLKKATEHQRERDARRPSKATRRGL